MAPIALRSNQPAARFYQGGAKIRSFRNVNGDASPGDRVPEDWVGSTTPIFRDAPVGLTKLPDGRLLNEAIEDNPVGWLGPEHLAKFGTDTKLLVKLLDAGQRLPVHIHPERSFAAKHLHHHHGKAEAWFIVHGGMVHLGFNRAVGETELERWVADQNVDEILAAMHEISVAPGDSVYVPPGLPHAIGAGILLVEVQEPEDLSILLEWKGFSIDGAQAGHLGLGLETALRAANRYGYSKSMINELIVRQGSGTSTLAPASNEYFRAESYPAADNLILDPGFSVLVVTDGSGSMSLTDGTKFDLSKGDTVLVPYSDGTLQLSGQLSIVRCRPPK